MHKEYWITWHSSFALSQHDPISWLFLFVRNIKKTFAVFWDIFFYWNSIMTWADILWDLDRKISFSLFLCCWFSEVFGDFFVVYFKKNLERVWKVFILWQRRIETLTIFLLKRPFLLYIQDSDLDLKELQSKYFRYY